MSLDDLALFLQRLIDRFVRRMRLGAAPLRGARRLLIVQIDGLPRSVLEQGLREGRMPFLERLLERRGYRLEPMSVGLPTSTPAFQLAAMYGVRPDIPGFHYHDKKRRADVYFPRGGDAGLVEATQARGRLGILRGGSTYGCVFTGGAVDNFFSFAMIKRPTGKGVVRVCSAFVVLGWVTVKCVVLTALELLRALMRLIADPVAEVRRGRWLVIKLGLSVWVREFFTLAVSRDLYRGVPAIYVNYLDYDVMAHSFGPRHRRATRSLRRLDRSLHQLWRVIRRVPEYRYDLYVLSDHGQTATTPFASLSGGRSLERLLVDEFFDPTGPRAERALASEERPASQGLVTSDGGVTSRGRELVIAIRAFHGHRYDGLFQRFFNYLQRDFLSSLRDVRETRQRGPVRVISAGPNAFVYFVDEEPPLTLERIDERHPGLLEALSCCRGIGFLLGRSRHGPVCGWRGARYRMQDLAEGPFAGRRDLAVVMDGIRDLMAMPSAGDLVIYGNGSPDGDVSYIPEYGAHAGPSEDELHTFVVHASDVTLPSPLVHPIQLYDHFIRYQTGPFEDAA